MPKEKILPTPLFDSQKYFHLTQELLNGISPEPESEHVYPLGGATEWIRMELQNNLSYESFGTKHRERHQELSALGFDPQRIAIIGIDPHGVMVKNIQEAYPNAQKIAIDLNSDKINQAKQEVAKMGSVKNKFEWFVGDATQILPKIEKVDLVDAQLVLIWGRDKAPLFYNPSNGAFPTRKMLTESIANSLTENGIATITDLIARQWHIEPIPGYESDPETLSLVESANQFISLLWKVGWDLPGGISWESDRQIIETIEKESSNKLLVNPHLSTIYDFPNSQKDSPISWVYALMTPAANDMLSRTAQQISAAIDSDWSSPELKAKLAQSLNQINGVSPVLNALSLKYINAICDPRIQTIPAPLAAMVFENK